MRWFHVFPAVVFVVRVALGQPIVGYYSLVVYPGENLIANQLSQGQNLLSEIFQYVPDGAQFRKWDPVAADYTQPAVYTAGSGWSIDYSLSYGEGGLFVSPELFTNVFAGEVWPGLDPNGFVPPLVTTTGLQLLSAVVPIDGAGFYHVVGRDPFEGEYVTWLDPAAQVYHTTVYTGGDWTQGAPAIPLGHSAFFYLVPVPEPQTILTMGALCVVLFLARVRRTTRDRGAKQDA